MIEIHGGFSQRFIVRIRSVCASAVVIVGLGQAAEAAIVNLDLRYEGTVLEDAYLFDTTTWDVLWAGDLDVETAPWVLPSLFPGASKGQTFQLHADIRAATDEYGGYVAPVCDIGGFDCAVTRWERYVLQEPLHVESDAFGVWQHGNTITVTSWGEYHLAGFHIVGDGYAGFTVAMTSRFTIIEPSPVPLPLPAALLPAGLGALALLRRRHRAA